MSSVDVLDELQASRRDNSSLLQRTSNDTLQGRRCSGHYREENLRN
jgi:hypothetical protein